jgi:hypothetical protein
MAHYTEGTNAKICTEDLRRAQIHMNTCKALVVGAEVRSWFYYD